MAAATARLRSSETDRTVYFTRWLTVWVVLLAVVVLVVVFYLIFITDSLASINKHLRTTTDAVVGAGGHVDTLPGQIENINTSLVSIDTALKPIPGQGNDIISALTTINSSLVAVDGSLKDTSGSLVNTSGSLVNTSGVLQTVLGTAGNINGVLIQANLPAGDCGNGAVCGQSQLGVQNIWQRLTNANPILASARSDTATVAGPQATGIDNNLRGICNGPVASVVKVLHPANC